VAIASTSSRTKAIHANRIHIHVAKRGEGDAKLWLYPDVTIAYNHGLDARAQRWISEQVSLRRQEIVSAWHEHFGTRDER
jgi:hypothetical protein